MSRKKRAPKKTRVWTASGKIQVRVLQHIQDNFEEDVTLKRLGDGNIAAIPARSIDRSAFDLFMIKIRSFKEVRMDLSKVLS
jgi:hypothetical protein